MTANLTQALGGDTNDVTGFSSMMSQLAPIGQPAATGMGSLAPISSLDLDGNAIAGNGTQTPADVLGERLVSTIAAQGAAGSVPYQAEYNAMLAPLLGPNASHAFINVPEASSFDGLGDFVIETPVFATPWSGGDEQHFKAKMPVFSIRTNERQSAPGFATLATLPLVNQMQLSLVEAERDAAISGTGLNTERNVRARAGYGGGPQLARPYVRGTTVNNEKLKSLRTFAALTAADLYDKLSYLGPITQISKNGDPPSYVPHFAPEVMTNFAFLNRAYIYNVFAPDLRAGDMLYFKVGAYDRIALLKQAAENKRGRWTRKRGAPESRVGYRAPFGSVANDVVQVRGFSSTDGELTRGMTTADESMKPHIADLFYEQREKRVASEYVEHEFDVERGMIVEKRRAQDEGAQERFANVPDVILENYLTPGEIYRVGTVKSQLNRATTTEALLNAHNDHYSLEMQPDVEIYMHHA